MDDTETGTTTGTVPRGAAAVSGVLAAGAALAAGELAASLAAPLPGPVYAVANRVVDQAPGWFVSLGKSLFGLADKPALVLGTTILALALGAGLGLASRRRPGPGRLGIAAFGVLGMVAIGTDAQGGWLGAVLVSLVAVAAGWVALTALRSRAARSPRTWAGAPPTGPGPAGTVASPVDPPVNRRSFLRLAGAVGATAALAGAGAGRLRSRSTAAEARAAVDFASALPGSELEAAVTAARSTPVAAVAGISPVIVPNDAFYRIDTSLLVPQIDPAGWRLKIGGMVDRELSLTYDELLARATTVAPVTLSCVSNPVGGDLVGNALWQGVALSELLDEAGVGEGATQIASRSIDGWTCGFPTEAAYDGRTALVAVAMNDEPLPLAHGFPARLVVAGLYGYVSATKWLSRIELTTWDGFDGYWVPRGWSKRGPIKTQSRIDTPRSGASFPAGEIVPIAGVAWAPDRGIERVEVRIDDGPWQEAELGDALGAEAWRQWVLRWTATAGSHEVAVRATDGTGSTQSAEVAPPAPDGASGWHRIELDVG